MTTPIEVFFRTTPNAWKITLALEEMELPHTIRAATVVEASLERAHTP